MKVLIIRFSSIGDIVLCSPVIRAMKLQANANVHFLTKNSYKSLLTSNPHIDKVFSFEEELNEVREALIAENYDFVVDLHRNLRSSMVKKWLKVPSGTFSKLNIPKWLLVNAKINRMPDLHIVDRYFQAISKFEMVQNDGQGLDYYIPENQEIDLSLYSEGLLHEKKFIVVVLGATYFTKRIPKDKAIEIAKKIEQPVVLVGGPEEYELGIEIAQESDNVINTCGTMTLNQSASLVRQCAGVVTGDTGMMHIAAAFKKPVAMIWGNTVPDFGMGPYMTETKHFEVSDLKCRPCSKLGHHKCPKGHFRCMKEQDITSILAFVEKYF